MLHYQIIQPTHTALASCIEHYMYVSGDGPPPSKKILPRPGVSLLFDFDAPFYCDGHSFLKALSGLRHHSFTYESAGSRADHFVVQFSPFGLSRFTPMPVDKLTDQIVEPGMIFGEDINDLYEQTESVDTLQQRLELIEAFLLERYAPLASTEDVIVAIAEKLRSNLDSVDFRTIKEQTPLSTRQIERKFKALVGVDMQTYIRICRFDRAKNLLLQNPSLRLTDVGLEAGYYDQPHFSNDFKRISGVSPRKFDHCMTP